MIGYLFNFTFIAECIAFLAALYLLDKKTGTWRLFIPFLSVTLVVETIGWYLIDKSRPSNNNWIYNILLLFNGIFTFWILSKADPLVKARRYLLICLSVFISFSIFNMLLFEGFWKYNGYTEMLLDLMTSIYICYFFYQVIAENVYRNLYKYEYFWIAIGFLFSSLGSVVLYIFIDSLTSYYNNTHINIYGYINYGLNVVLYGSLIISFICRRRSTRSLPGL
ncbi:MAG TPA: hypothetical protein VGG71_03770 [Chitinophagaceae bacterium]